MAKFFIPILININIQLILCNANAPNIDYSHNMRVLKLPKNTKVGSIIYRLKGSDADNDHLKFGVRGPIGGSLLEIVSASFFEADVYLKKPLEEKEYKITIFVTDGVLTTEVESTIMTYDEDAPSPFVHVQPIFRIYENVSKNETVAYVVAKDKQFNISNIPVTFELRGSDYFGIKYVFGPKGASRADIILLHNVDYEKKNLYVLTILALNAWTNESIDTRNIASLDIVIVIEDVQDTPPVFLNLPNVVQISTNVKIGTTIFHVKAEDGDYGNPRNVTYSIDSSSPMNDFFTIDEMKGDLILKNDVSVIRRIFGSEPISLKIIATEIIDGKILESLESISSSSYLILIITNATDNNQQTFNIIDLKKFPRISGYLLGKDILTNENQNDSNTIQIAQTDYTTLIWLLIALIIITFLFLVGLLLSWCFCFKNNKSKQITNETKILKVSDDTIDGGERHFQDHTDNSNKKQMENTNTNTNTNTNKRKVRSAQDFDEDAYFDNYEQRHPYAKPSSAPYSGINEYKHPHYYDSHYLKLSHPTYQSSSRMRKAKHVLFEQHQPDYHRERMMMRNHFLPDIEDVEDENYYSSRDTRQVFQMQRIPNESYYDTRPKFNPIRHESYPTNVKLFAQNLNPDHDTRPKNTEILIIKSPPSNDQKKENVENSDKSDSDSGICGHFAKNKQQLDLKNSNKMEKQSIFTVAYNDIKMRNIDSSGSNDE